MLTDPALRLISIAAISARDTFDFFASCTWVSFRGWHHLSGAAHLVTARAFFVVLPQAVRLAARPCLLGKIRQIVHPIFLLHTHRIDHMGQIVFCIRQNKGRVTYFVTPTGAHC